jgi:hypothetical protein
MESSAGWVPEHKGSIQVPLWNKISLLTVMLTVPINSFNYCDQNEVDILLKSF